ncbi:tRNA pseudouridine(13) synthase TruD [Methanosphaera sp. WGK6]|uniref:tRNA pseudouridine(13) synthase TruD n=1 Tax=Methanosphaera sp. WGK6 TaxID=1561964 RepID=UPI00084BD749|nr:tRNA pseudouridine(13) synthase TruD [Methanosphaera sp. WGK6]OED30280.1 pseudouridine synthase [Methanosphaera sp. WGK6]
MLNAETFITNNKGTNGTIRELNEDFYVEEVPLALPTGEGPNTWIQIEKNGRTTLDVVLDMARALHISRKRTGFAGMKDRSAITRQWLCISNITPEELPNFEEVLHNVKVLDIKQNQKKLRMGQLKGNKFKINIKNTDDPCEDKKIAEEVLESLKITGVPNYYGYQRFGEVRSTTHLVGKCLVESDIKKAVDTYIGNPNENEHNQPHEARQLYDEGKLQESYNLMPKSMRYEKSMLKELIHAKEKRGEITEKDYIKAIESLPKPLKRMFVNAYESYLFNKIINERSKIGINKYYPGDIIIDQEERWIHEIDETTIEEDINNFTVNPTAPLLGSKVPLAEGIQGEIEEKVIKEENITKKSFECPKTPKLGSHGVRRSIRFKIEDTHVEEINNGIRVEFFIPRGCYATAVLREIIKKNI